MLGLEGKVALVFGVASEDSIAWSICQKLAQAGCKLYLGYQKRFMSRVFQLKDKLPQIQGFYPLDVSTDDATAEFFTEFSKENPNLKVDVMIHAIGFAPKECFDRHILFVDNDAINTAITISANSLQRVMRHAMPHLNNNSSTINQLYSEKKQSRQSLLHRIGISKRQKEMTQSRLDLLMPEFEKITKP